MILIDDEKTVIAGEAGRIMIELALVVDRFIHELDDKNHPELEYDKTFKKFMELLQKIRDITSKKSNMSPNDILKDPMLNKLFKDGPFVVDKGSRGKSNSSSSSAEDLLKQAMDKLNKAKKKSKKDKKKKK